ncbi:uncharacterized protein LOC127865590 isoform X2 [Dreissena polymorpha]|uniref:uncharacterized protein LOC127865590 isoform X2 n=1 Tax=Dreissena polymorpha TaxID=45954 RepID=UPI0022653E61|nr:uncharacterized protein LOC127865590 isoform X2 [Dreissena polymorpha]
MLYLRYGLYLMALGSVLMAPKIRAEEGLSTTVMVNGGIFLNNPCNPAVRHCHYQCTLGYKVGTDGCQHCICNEPPSTSGYTETTTAADRVGATTSPPKYASTTPALSISQAPLHTTSLVATVKATSAPFGTAGGFTDPCISTQKTCSKDCLNGYVKGPGGCQYCLCMTVFMVTTTTTTPVPAAGHPLSTPVPHFLDLSPTSEACIMAKVICNDKCPSGFVSRPDDCLYCACHKDDLADDPEEDDFELQTPCLSHRNQCPLQCLKGFVAGPRHCQFCACA